MPDDFDYDAPLLDQGAAALIERQEQAAGRRVVYQRGNTAINLTAWPGDARFTRTPEEPGTVYVNADKAYLFDRSALVIDGARTLPEADDRIGERIRGEWCWFEVRPTADDPGWNFQDPATRSMICVRVQRVGAL